MTNAPVTNNATDDSNMKHQITATQIETDCPNELQEWGKNIAGHYERALKSEEKADQHYQSIGQYLAKAKEGCDEAGFEAFRKKFCPNFAKTRAYELLAVGQNKKSIADLRASTRERVARHRAKQSDGPRAEDSRVRYVTDKSGAEAQQEVPERATTVEGAPADPAKPRRAVSPGDPSLREFDRLVLELRRKVSKFSPERFVATAVPADDLARLGKVLTGVAALLKEREDNKPTIRAHGNDVSPEQSAEDMKEKHAAREAAADAAA